MIIKHGTYLQFQFFLNFFLFNFPHTYVLHSSAGLFWPWLETWSSLFTNLLINSIQLKQKIKSSIGTGEMSRYSAAIATAAHRHTHTPA